jgi:hypothetical protein
MYFAAEASNDARIQYFLFFFSHVGQDTVDVTAARYGLDGPVIEPG